MDLVGSVRGCVSRRTGAASGEKALSMPENTVPPRLKRDLDNACKKAGEHVRKLTPGRQNKAAVARAFNQRLCKDVDQKLLKALAQQLAKQGKKYSAKPEKNTLQNVVKGVPKLTPPGKGVPSVTIPIPWAVPLEGVTGNRDTKGKFELKIWADPRELEKKSKGGMLFFTVKF